MSNNITLTNLETHLIHLIQNETDLNALFTEIGSVLGRVFKGNSCYLFPYCKNQEWGPVYPGRTEEITPAISPSDYEALRQELNVKADQVEPIAFSFKNLPTSLQEKFLVSQFLGIKIAYKNRINGIILIGQIKKRNWTQKEQDILLKISQILGIFFHFSELESVHYHRLDFIQNLTKKLRQESDQEKIFNLILTETAQYFKCDRTLVLRLKYSKSLYQKSSHHSSLQTKIKLTHEWTPETKIKKIDHVSFSTGDCFLCQKFLNQGSTPFLITDLHEQCSPEERKEIHPFFQSQLYRSFIFIPLIRPSQNLDQTFVLLGYLVLQQEQPSSSHQEENSLLNWISLQLSNTLIQTQSLRQVQNIVDERTSQLKWSLEVQGKLSEKMRQQIQQLQKLNELKDDFMSSMSHELNTPLATMKVAIKMLRKTGDFSDRQLRYLDILEQEWNREFNLIKDLLTLQKLESHQFTVDLKEVEIEPILNQVINIFKTRWLEEKELQFEWNLNTISSPAKIYTDQESFEHILTELLLNAGKYSLPETLIILNIDQEIKAGQENLIIEISNCGSEISEEERPYIFDKFRRGKGSTDQAIPGTGLGLTLVKMLVQQLHGTIEVSCEKDTEEDYFITTFTVILPHFKGEQSFPLLSNLS